MNARLAAFAAALFLVTSAPLKAEPIIQTVEEHRNDVGEIERRGDLFVHRPSGYVFPGSLGDMPARKTITYGPNDASLYYTRFGGGNGDAWLSLFVYRATLPLKDEVASVEGSLAENMPGAVAAQPPGLPPRPTGAIEKWYDASLQGVPMTTGYRLVRDGDWYVKVRLSIPKTGGQTALERAWSALGAVRWKLQ